MDLGYDEVIVTRLTTHGDGKAERSLMLKLDIGGVQITVQPQDLDRFTAEVVKARRWVTTGEGGN